ncbi:MAG: ATP-binding protein [Lachnospiraceae bacterium]|nr:ATP-binding protein [Lachnospiraceae bacterium]
MINLFHMDNRATLTVVNTDTHIDEKDLPHLFEAFYRADKSARYGSGLGLYITQMVLENYQVAYSIQNTENGVKFTAVFPLLHTNST